MVLVSALVRELVNRLSKSFFNEDGKDYRECVACGYKDEMRFKPVQRELETRVNISEEEKADVQVVTILPFTKASE